MCLGSALDILGSGRPPRATFVDYPLGHTAGKPFEPVDQLDVVREALRGFETMTEAGSVRVLPNQWDASGEWKKEAGRTGGADTRRPRDETPQFQHNGDREAARASGALPD
jgi:hypothetical protein